jgi:hypothetical protein
MKKRGQATFSITELEKSSLSPFLIALSLAIGERVVKRRGE